MRALLMIALLLSSSAHAGRYGMEAGDQRRSNRAQAPSSLRGPLNEAWSVSLGITANNHPIILDDRVIVISGSQARCVRRSDGQLLWSAYVGPQTKTGTYDAARGLLYLAGSTGTLTALRASDGSTAWSYSEPRVGSGYNYASALLLPGSIIFCTVGQGIVALDPDTRAVQWRYASTEAMNTPSHDNGRIYLSTRGRDLLCLDAASGALVWKRTMADPSATAVTLGDNLLYLMSNTGRIEAYRRSDGVLVWSYATSGYSLSNLALCDGALVAASDDRFVYCLDPLNGALKWRKAFAGNFARCAPIIVCGVVYITGCAGEYYGLDIKDGATLWVREHLYMNSFVDWAVDGDDAFVTDQGGRLHCFRALEPADPALCDCYSDTNLPPVDPTPPACLSGNTGALDGLALWLEAEDAQVDASGRVAFWPDRSGNHRHANSAEHRRPHPLGPDSLGRRSVDFRNQTGCTMAINRSPKMVSDFRRMTVLAKLRMRPNPAEPTQYFFGGGQRNGNDYVAFGASQGQWVCPPGWVSPHKVTFNATTLYSFRDDGATQLLRVNGQAATRASGSYGSSINVPYLLGNQVTNPSTYFSGELHKLMVFDRALSDAEIAAVEACWNDPSDPIMPIPTLTSTPTPSNTKTPWFSPTRTGTVTPTVTATGTPTASPTASPTLTASPTATVTATHTPYQSPTNTPTVTVTSTPAPPKEEDCAAKIEQVVLVPNPWNDSCERRHAKVKLACSVDKVEVELFSSNGSRVCTATKVKAHVYKGDWLQVDFPEHLKVSNGTYYCKVTAYKGISKDSKTKALAVVR